MVTPLTGFFHFRSARHQSSKPEASTLKFISQVVEARHRLKASGSPSPGLAMLRTLENPEWRSPPASPVSCSCLPKGSG